MIVFTYYVGCVFILGLILKTYVESLFGLAIISPVKNVLVVLLIVLVAR